MLVIRRRAGQSVLIGDSIEIEVIEAGPARVKLGITAPKEILVLRKEISITREQNLSAAQGVSQEAVRNLARRMRPEAAGKPRQETDGRQNASGARSPGAALEKVAGEEDSTQNETWRSDMRVEG
ncbi:MAG TPA: carbon storage regulator [Bryobacteraceae bacterium]|nr:carbon storage regulator [Bryobacteraceae bacterium]